MEIGGAELTEVVQTLRRQSERKVREEIVSDLKGRLEQLRRSAIRLEAGKWTTLMASDVRGRLEECSYDLWVVQGSPGRGISHSQWAVEYPLPGHRMAIRGYPAGRPPVGFTAACTCTRPMLGDGLRHDEWGWSPTVMGAKRLARRHAGLM